MSHFQETARMCFVPLLAMISLASAAVGQDRLWYAEGDDDNCYFGRSIDVAQDRDGDGFPELLIGADGTTCTAAFDGVVSLFSTTSGELSRACGVLQESLGSGCAVIGDIDGDGLEDIVAGGSTWDNPTISNETGRVLVLSSASGATLIEVDGTEPVAYLGTNVVALPDVNGDGIPEFLAAEPHYAYGGPYQAGRVFLCSGADGSKLRTYIGDYDGDRLGKTLVRLGDVDADGVADYALSEVNTKDWDKGKVLVYSSLTGSLLQTWIGDQKFDQLGVSVADAGDLDGDGHADVLCASGGVRVAAYSGASGTKLFEFEDHTYKQQQFGFSCSMAGDMNGDGFEEIVVGAVSDKHDGVNAGRVDLISGKTHRALYHFYPGRAGSYFGFRVIGRVDFNSDGMPDVVTSAPYWKTQTGRVSIFSGNDLFLQAEPLDPDPGDTVTIEIRGGEAGAIGLMAVTDISGTPMFLPLLINLLDANGEVSVTATVPSAATGLDVTLIGYAQKLTGKPRLIDTSLETISVQ